MIFEWDEDKNRTNIRKHDVSFENALHVFDDPYRIDFFDLEHSTSAEERWQTIGLTPSNLLFVIYTIKEEDSIYRLISARKANAREERQYYQSRI